MKVNLLKRKNLGGKKYFSIRMQWRSIILINFYDNNLMGQGKGINNF